MSVLICGGAGFIGSHLVDLLISEGFDIIVIDDLSSGFIDNLPNSNKVTFVKGDVNDKELVNEYSKACEMIFHFAAEHPNIVGHIMKSSLKNPANDVVMTLRSTINILEAAMKNDSKVIFASTAAVYGEPATNPVSEDYPINTISPYGLSKYCAELYCRFYYKEYGLKTYIGRIFNSYGPRMRKYLLFDAMHKLLSDPDNLKLLGSGEEVRDFIYVKDTANAFYIISRSNKYGEAVNIGTGKGLKVKDVIGILLDELNIKPRIEFIGNSWRGNAKSIVADNRLLISLGFKQKYSINYGIKEFVRWFNNYI